MLTKQFSQRQPLLGLELMIQKLTEDLCIILKCKITTATELEGSPALGNKQILRQAIS